MYRENNPHRIECAGHRYGPWDVVSELHNDVDVWQRACGTCGKVDTHIGHMPPDGWVAPNPAVINPAPANAIKEKLQFLVDVASKLTRQRPGLPVVYIAGKVTGLTSREVQHKFGKAKLALELQGFLALNPCDFISHNEDWQTAMRMATTLLCMSEHIYLLPDWQDSKGARMEFEMATQFGITTITI